MLKRYLVLITAFFITIAGFSQGRASENRKKNAISSDNEYFFGSEDPDFDVTEIPEKWKTESAVILCRKFIHDYDKEKRLMHKESVRTRVKLNDQAAIENFSIFYYSYTKTSRFGIRITKPDGSNQVVSLDEAVDVGINEVPDYYKSYSRDSYKKIAIPNLEKGDIVDYYFGSEIESYAAIENTGTAYQYVLNSSYPILKQSFFVQLSRGLKFAYRSFHSERTFEEGGPGVDEKGREIRHSRTFTFVDENRERSKPEYWKYKTLDSPSIKFQVRWTTLSPEKTSLFVTEDELITEPYSLELIQQKLVKRRQMLSYPNTPADIAKNMRKNREDYGTDEELAVHLYYELRDGYTKSKINNYGNTNLSGYTYTIDDVYFSNTFSYVLTELDIPHKLVVAVDREYGSFENVLFRRALTTGIKVGDKYFYQFSNFTNHDHIPKNLLGAEAFEFDFEYPFKRKEMPAIEKIKIGSKTYDQNLVEKTHTVSISEDFTYLNVEINNVFKGLSKAAYTGTAVYQFNYLFHNATSEELVMGGTITTSSQKGNKARIAEAEREKKAELAEKMEKKLEYFKGEREDDYEVESYDAFELISVGRDSNTTDLIYNETMTVNGLIAKAGRNHILKVGELIGKQLELDKDDMERESNIHINYAKGYNHTININIPEGYEVAGYNELNTNTVNEMGEFTVVTSYDNKVLNIKVSKLYKTQDSTKENWAGYVAFIEEAYNFTQKKIIIKKVQ